MGEATNSNFKVCLTFEYEYRRSLNPNKAINENTPVCIVASRTDAIQ